MRKTIFGLLMFVTLTTNCANAPVYEDSKSVEENLTALEKGLTPDEVDLLRETIGAAVMGAAFAKAFGMDVGKDVVKSAFTGKTARQIVDDAKAELCQDAKNKVVANSKTIEEIKAKISQEEAYKTELAKVEVSGTLVEQKIFYTTEKVVKLNIKNNHSKTLKRIGFHVVYKSDGRELPWSEFDVNIAPEGGLQTGETEKGTYRTPWSFKGDIHKGAKAIMSATWLEFADGSEIKLDDRLPEKLTSANKDLAEANKKLQEVQAKWGCQVSK